MLIKHNRNLIIGVASDAYIESFKRTPVQTLDERINTIMSIFKSTNRVTVSEQINKSGLKPIISILDVFKKYDFYPDKELYAPLLNDISYVSHGDMAFTNIVKGQGGITP